MLFFKPAEEVQADLSCLPRHIAIIMDGNGRWARKRGLPRTAGHAAGAETFRTIATYCKEIGLEYLTVYAFSTENWKRPAEEVGAIMGLLKKYLLEAIGQMERDRVKMEFFGDLSPLPQELRDLCQRTREISTHYEGCQVNICLNYGGRDELLRAARAYAQECLEGKADPNHLSEAQFSGGCRTRISSSGPAESCGCPISCRGSPPIRNFISQTCCGPTSPRKSSTGPSRPIRAAAADLEVYDLVTRIVVSVVLAPLFFVILFFLPPVYLAVLMAAICALASYELLRATGVAHHNGLYGFTAAAAAAIPLGQWLGRGALVAGIAAVLLVVTLFYIAIRLYDEEQAIRVEDVLLCFFGGLMIPMALSTLVVLKGMEHGRYLVLLPVLCAFLTDGGAYFAGVFLGKHRGITKVSPNKSLEGYIGGILSGALFLLLYGVILRQFAGLEVSLPVMAVYGLLGSAVTELGDLSFSLIKRQFGIKDYGNLLPGHGGMLDRFDSMTFAAPTLLILVTLLPAF